MTAIYLPAGTDVAEMALFDVDAIPCKLPCDVEDFSELASQGRLIRFPTGADGGYLLQLLVDEPIPEETRRYCLADDKLTGEFCTSEGRIAFGGLESAFAEFKPNANIRADGTIEPGRYAYTAYRTEFPDELVIQAVRVERTTGEWWLGRAPVLATLALLSIAFALAMARQFVPAGVVLVCGLLIVKWLQRLPGYQALVSRREQAQLAFPSIVIALQSNPSPHRTARELYVERRLPSHNQALDTSHRSSASGRKYAFTLDECRRERAPRASFWCWTKSRQTST